APLESLAALETGEVLLVPAGLVFRTHVALSCAVYEVGNQAPFRHLIVFFTESRTIHARDQAFCFRVLACSSSAFFLPRRSPLTRGWGRAAGEKECCSFLRMSSTRRSLLVTAIVSAGVFAAQAVRPDNRLSV